jgi:hypothetical protein
VAQPRGEGLAQLAERKIAETIEAEEEMDDGDGFVSAIWDEGSSPPGSISTTSLYAMISVSCC